MNDFQLRSPKQSSKSKLLIQTICPNDWPGLQKKKICQFLFSNERFDVRICLKILTEMIDFVSKFSQIWNKFWLRFEIILGENGGPSGPRFERNPKELQCFSHIGVLRKGSVLGTLFGDILSTTLIPFGVSCFGAGHPPKSLLCQNNILRKRK